MGSHGQGPALLDWRQEIVKAVSGISKEALRQLAGALGPEVLKAPSSTPKAQPQEKLQIQALGSKGGCHVCGFRYPRRSYETDHSSPGAFDVPWMREMPVNGGSRVRRYGPSARGARISRGCEQFVVAEATVVAAALNIRVNRPGGVLVAVF